MSERMKPFRPVFWPVPVFYRDELKPTKRGKRSASNYGFWIIAKKGTPSWVIEQEKYESRYWVLHFWRLIDFFWFYAMKPRQWFDGEHLMSDVLDWRYPKWKKAAAHLASVECQSRAQEIRARNKRTHEDWRTLARDYARSIHKTANYPFFQAAGWGEERIYNEIIKHL